MWDNVKISLYDLFGYFYPGAIFLLALAIILWTIFPALASSMVPPTSNASWIVLIMASYLAGHFVQAVATMAFQKEKRELRILGEIPLELMVRIRLELKEAFGLDTREVGNSWLLKICDVAFQQTGHAENRLIYESREGFYRGLVVSAASLFVACFARMAVPGGSLRWAGDLIELKWPFLAALQLLGLAASWLFYRRYLRFTRYRVHEIIIGFLATQKMTPRKEEDNPEE